MHLSSPVTEYAQLNMHMTVSVLFTKFAEVYPQAEALDGLYKKSVTNHFNGNMQFVMPRKPPDGGSNEHLSLPPSPDE